MCHARFAISARPHSVRHLQVGPHSSSTMSSNFGTGQSLFGGSTSNQNKNQSTSNPGSTPAPPSIFGNLGANTTTSAAFGGAGAGSAPSGGGTASGTAGNNIFGTGGSAFGGAGNANKTTTPTPAGAGAGTGSSFGGPSLFPGEYASLSIFLKPSHSSMT